jgi:hypothetical protein
MASRQYSSTVVSKTLSAGINSSITTMSLNDLTTLPNAYPYTLVIDPDLATEEAVTVLDSPATNTLTITRGQDGTGATEHTASAVVKHMITPRDLQEPQNHIEAASAYTIKNDGVNAGVTGPTISKSVHGIATGEGAVVGTLKEQTLTLKTLTSPTISNPTISGTITGTGVVSSTNILDNTIVNADINSSAAIDWTKLAVSSTVSATELGYVDGVTSAIQTQLNTKAPSAAPTFTGTVVLPSTTSIGNVSSTELGYVDGVTSAIQTQLNGKLATTGGTVNGNLIVTNGELKVPGVYGINFGNDDYITFDDTTNRYFFGCDGGNAADADFMNIYMADLSVNEVNSLDTELISTYCRPTTDNTVYLGSPSRRWIRVYAVNTTISSSDERDKLDVIESPLGLDFINELRPVAYRWKIGEKTPIVDENGERILDENGNYTYETREGIRKHYGLISQEVKQAVDNSGVDDFAGWVKDDLSDPDSHQSLSYEQFIAPLIKSVQELSAEVETLKSKVAELEAK